MRILHLIDSGGLYGAERMLLSLVQQQQRLGLQSMILSAGDPAVESKALEAEARVLGLPVTPWRMKPGLNLTEAWRILSWARQLGFDLLHSHGYKFNVLMGLWPRKLRRIPLVITLHGYVQSPRWTKLAAYEAMDRLTLRFADRVVIVDQGMRSILPRTVATSARCIHIPNGIALESPGPATVPKDIAAFLKPYARHVLAVGRLSREKGFDRLIRIVRENRACLGRVGIVIIGEGPERSALAAAIQGSGLGTQIYLAGYRSNVPALMQHFDALLMPSLTEGLPITVLEALRARLPIIASAVGGIPAVLEAIPSATLVPPGDDKAFGAALIRAARTDPSAVDTALGAEAFMKHYSADRMAASYAALYTETLANARHPANRV